MAALGIGHGVQVALHRIEPAVAFGDLFDGFAICRVADEQTQFLHIGQHVGHGFEAGEKEIADGKMRGRAAGQRLLDDVDEFDVLVVDEVVGHKQFTGIGQR